LETVFSTVVGFSLGLLIIFVLGKIFLKPIRFILKLIFNSILGGVLIFIINLFGNFLGFHIGLNAVTSVAVGLLGIPAVIIMLILQIFF